MFLMFCESLWTKAYALGLCCVFGARELPLNPYLSLSTPPSVLNILPSKVIEISRDEQSR